MKRGARCASSVIGSMVPMMVPMKVPTAAVALLLLALGGVDVVRCAGADGELVFEDNFDTLDESHWGHLVTAWDGGNNEFQYYRNSRNNSYVRDGILYIRPTFTADEFGEDFVYHGRLADPDCNMEPCTSQAGAEIVKPVLSARMSTQNKFSFKYGRLDIRAKLPKGDWLWPAMWLLPERDVFGPWPRSGEIDLVESRGNEHLTDGAGTQQGVRHFSSCLHYGPAWNIRNMTYFYKSVDSNTLVDAFHVYSMEWSESGVRFLLDGQQTGDLPAPAGGFWRLGGFQGDDIWSGQPMAPFNQEFYLILNVAVGGNFFYDGLRNEPYPRPWRTGSNQAMREFWDKRGWWQGTWRGEDAALQVDYVRVHRL